MSGYEGEERRGDLKEVIAMLAEIKAPASNQQTQPKGLAFNKGYSLAFILSVLVMLAGGFKSITLAFADLESHDKSIKVLQNNLVTQQAVDNVIFRQQVEKESVATAINGIKKTQEKLTNKLEKISDRQRTDYNSLRNLIIEQRK